MIQFLLNREVCTERDLDPNTTVLNYLREHRGKTGTKEGCASGDCGACTVVVGELNADNTIRYRSLNACLTFVSALHGKQLITVEDLKDGQTMHPVQQAMADCHGSQCGFCTPGFVMSLFALDKSLPDNAPQYNQQDTLEALAGNLCRCTGYRPILDAAKQSVQHHTPDQFDAAAADTVAALQQITPQAGATLVHDDKRCMMPTSSDELAEQYLAHPDAKLLAGGTDLALEVTQFQRSIPTMIYVGQARDMQQVEGFDDRLEFGAAAPLTDCYELLADEYPDFGALLHRFASLQIRNQGTLGGNIGNASPIGDSPPLLIALGASIVLRRGSVRRTLLLEDYFLDYKKTDQQPSEFIEKIIVPRAGDYQFRAYKISKRLDDDISAVCAAFCLRIESGIISDARVAFGGMAATPKRAKACEQALIGAAWQALIGAAWQHDSIEAACAALAQDFTPLTDFRASREYRLSTAQNLLRKYFLEIQSPTVATRVTDYV
ncbi:MAG: xanthine dehydrogenase small subunit [Natronospirillum sp.]